MMENGPRQEDEKALAWHEGDMPYSQAYGDHFYCRTDGRLECGHVFLAGNGLPDRWSGCSHFTIGELGFGTGLNFAETWRQWRRFAPPAASLHFISFELHPMRGGEIDRALSRWPDIANERQALIEAWPERPAERVELSFAQDVRLTVVCGDALANLSGESTLFDAWYLDGFAPARNPAMWSLELMAAVYGHTRPGGGFATYAAAGFVRRNLTAAGFAVERHKGFAGKREMLRGLRPEGGR